MIYSKLCLFARVYVYLINEVQLKTICLGHVSIELKLRLFFSYGLFPVNNVFELVLFYLICVY